MRERSVEYAFVAHELGATHLVPAPASDRARTA